MAVERNFHKGSSQLAFFQQECMFQKQHYFSLEIYMHLFIYYIYIQLGFHMWTGLFQVTDCHIEWLKLLFISKYCGFISI